MSESLLTANLTVLASIIAVLIFFAGSVLIGFAVKVRRLHRRVSRLEEAVVASTMEEGNPAKRIQAELVLKTYERILSASIYTERDFAMREARRLCGYEE